jgi:hypothetical protein
MESPISISQQQNRPIPGKELSGGFCISVSANAFSFNHVYYLQRVSLNLPQLRLDNNNRRAETLVVYRKLLKIEGLEGQ